MPNEKRRLQLDPDFVFAQLSQKKGCKLLHGLICVVKTVFGLKYIIR